MTIKHTQTGEVVGGVEFRERFCDNRWEKNHVRYYPEDGWEEAKEKTWRDVTGECQVWGGSICHGDVMVDGRSDYSFRFVDCYDFPEDFKTRFLRSSSSLPWSQFVESFKRKVLIIEKDEVVS